MVAWCLIIFTFFLSFSESLVIHTSQNTSDEINQHYFQSYYTTLGLPSTHQILTSSPVLLSRNNFSDDCFFTTTTNISLLNGAIVVVSNYPLWLGCTSDNIGVIPAVGRIIQQVGGIAVLIPPLEKVSLSLFVMLKIQIN